MTGVLAGALGLILCMVSDLFQLRGRNVIRQILFFLGCIVQCCAAGWLLQASRFWRDSISIWEGVGLFLGAGGLGLLIYTLFFSLPKAAYGAAETGVVSSGVWGLCRHPGLWFFVLCMLGLGLLGGTAAMWQAFFLWSTLDFLYVLLQDRLVFPKTLRGYDVYQSSVPFLIPRFFSDR